MIFSGKAGSDDAYPARLTRESTADCVVKVLVPAEFVDAFGSLGLYVHGHVRLVRKDDGYALEIEDVWPDE